LFIKTDEQINMRIFGQLSNFALISVDLKLLKCPGATRARNLGVKCSTGAVVVFIDSDLVVTSDFLHAHGAALLEAHKQDGDDQAFTYGRVINTSNFERPEAENFKLTVYFLHCISLPSLILVSLRICQQYLLFLGWHCEMPANQVGVYEDIVHW
jgi:glycosyltransferase involved in cell wall biosynthesis